LFTSVSILPKARGSWRRGGAFLLDPASQTTATALPPAFALALVSLTSSAERAATTCAPSRAKRRLNARPMPLDAPVMTNLVIE
jgi:hypothetical protein